MGARVRHIVVLGIVTVLAMLSLLICVGIPGAVKARGTRLGLDLKGGTQLTYKAVTPSGKTPSSAQLNDAINIMRSRINQIGVSGNEITSYGGNEITVSVPDVQNGAEAARVVGAAGQLHFYDWEDSVVNSAGRLAGPNDPAATCDNSTDGFAACGMPYYQAVMLASRQPEHHYALASDPVAVYYYVDGKTRVVYPVGPEPTVALLNADVAQRHVRLATSARVVEVKPGTVVIQATSAPEVPVPNDFFVLRDDPVLTGKSISDPQATTDPTNGIVVSFGFKGDGASVFQNVTATLARRGQAHSLLVVCLGFSW